MSKQGLEAYNGSRNHFLRRLFYMKIVLLRSPGFLSPILRRIFGIKKEKKRR